MLLTIHYQNGEKRVLNLTPDFFTSEPSTVFNKKTNKVDKIIETPSMKAMKLANSLGVNPFIVRLERNGSVQLNNVNYDSKPYEKASSYKIDEKDVKKKLKQEYKSQLKQQKQQTQ